MGADAFRLGYRPAFDGLRAIAILSVMGFHSFLRFKGHTVIGGGSLGVDLFFVLSGFLITTLLIEEWERNGSISLRAFYRRRCVRLLPGLVAFIALLSLGLCVAAMVSSEFRTDAKSTLIAIPVTLGYIGNWLIAFQALGLGGLTMTWSLAIEEQFYLIWPLMLIVLLRRGARRSRIAVCLLTAAVLCAIWRVVLIESGASSVRVMRGSDTRADGIIIGCALGVLATSGFISVVARHSLWARLLACAGAGTMLAMILAPELAGHDTHTSALLSLHLLVFALAAAAIVATVLAFPEWWVTRALSVTPLVWVGRISYGLYLWHSAFAWVIGEHVGYTPANALLAIILGFTFAAASRHFIESPAMRLKDQPLRLKRPVEVALDVPVTAQR